MLPAGFVPPGEKRAAAQPFCRVQITARPSSDSDIKFEMWLPNASNWNGRFLANGGGGNSGAITYSRLTEGLARGYASLSTDNGHVSKVGNIHEQSWAVGHSQKVIDFGYRAQAVTAVAGKQITRVFCLLWIARKQVVLDRMLPRWWQGRDAGATVSRELRRHRGRCPGPRQDRIDALAGMGQREGNARPRAGHPASQAAHDPQGSAGGVRRAGRAGRWAVAGAWKVQMRNQAWD
nr:tannase/feruloyl esterase family alpha/beta hydrolase [Variovorax beijingensis]